MIKAGIPFLIFLFPLCLFAQLDYQWVNPYPVGWNLNAITFSDAETGWAVGEKGTVLLSANGGRSWRKFELGTQDELTDVHFVDERNGWISSLKGNVYHTSDGGRYWSPHEVPFQDPVSGIYFLDADSGFAVTLNGKIYKTIDRGYNWFQPYYPPEFHMPESFSAIHFVDSLRGWVVGMDGVVKRTIDGGDIWYDETLPTRKNPDFGFHMLGIHFVDEFIGWAVGEEGRIVRTQNGGRVWREQFSGTETKMFSDVYFKDSKQGWVVGEGGTLLYTEDGGELWLELPTQEGAEARLGLMGIYGNQENGLWVVGEKAFMQHDAEWNQRWKDKTSGTRDDLRQVAISLGQNKRIFLLTSEGEILREEMGSTSFSEYVFPQEVNFRKILLFDDNRGFFLEKKENLWYSKDVGSHLKKIDLSKFGDRFYDITFADEQHGWITGAGGLILESTDGGMTWQKGFVTSRQDLWQIAFANDQIGWMISLQGEVWHTSDGGKRWDEVPLPETTVLTDMELMGKDGLIITTAKGTYWHTSNHGKSWTKRMIDFESRLIKIAMHNQKEGVILTDGRTYYFTRNGGKKWKQGLLPDFARPREVIFLKGKTFIIGDEGLMLMMKW